MPLTIRPFREVDRDAVHRITLACFDHGLHATAEALFGRLRGTTWQDRKLADVDRDLAAESEGALVAEVDGEVVGFVTTSLNHDTGVGAIANLAVDPAAQGRGLGRALVEAALRYFVEQGMAHARIETLEGNQVGRHLYPSLGFRELDRQVYYMLALPAGRAGEPPGEAGSSADGDH